MCAYINQIVSTMCLERGLAIIILASLGCRLVFSDSPIQTPAEHKMHFLRRENLDRFFGLNPKRNRIMPPETREYKCQILNTL